MQLTVTPKRPSCTARVLVRCTSEVLRAPPLRLPALRALVPLTLMMRPQRCSFMCGMTARAQRSAPTYLTLKSCSRSSSTTVSMGPVRSEEHTSELQSHLNLVCRLLLEKKKKKKNKNLRQTNKKKKKKNKKK